MLMHAYLAHANIWDDVRTIRTTSTAYVVEIMKDRCAPVGIMRYYVSPLSVLHFPEKSLYLHASQLTRLRKYMHTFIYTVMANDVTLMSVCL